MNWPAPSSLRGDCLSRETPLTSDVLAIFFNYLVILTLHDAAGLED